MGLIKYFKPIDGDCVFVLLFKRRLMSTDFTVRTIILSTLLPTLLARLCATTDYLRCMVHLL